jgi:hypothetical protein
MAFGFAGQMRLLLDSLGRNRVRGIFQAGPA